jgi:hypothetical protein
MSDWEQITWTATPKPGKDRALHEGDTP